MRTGTLRFKNEAEFAKWFAATKGIDLNALAPKSNGPSRAMTLLLAFMGLVLVAPLALFTVFWGWVLLMALLHS